MRWSRFAYWFYGSFAGLIALCLTLIALVDPYKIFPFSLPLDRPVMDINQRYFYPMIARSQLFDSLVIGTSTIRLVDPQQLDDLLGGRFANLAMNSATAWEQLQILDLFVRENGAPKTLIIGIDSVWCDRDAEANKITFRGFPDWLYDDDPLNDIPNAFNLKSLEFSVRAVAYWLGLRDARIRFDGFEVFVPDEADYDLAKAQTHIWGDRVREIVPVEPPYVMADVERAALRFPALGRLEAALRPLAGKTRIIAVAVPVHVAAQPIPQSQWAAIEQTCKERLAEIISQHNGVFSDWRVASDITRKDENFWDHLHIRLPLARQFTEDLAQEVRAVLLKDRSH